jgi:hypothetical protein
LADEEPVDLDCEAGCLLLFGLACASNIAETGVQERGAWRAAAQRLAEKLTGDSASEPSAIRSEFEAGRFVTPLMAAAVSGPWGAAGRLLRSACEREWQTLDQNLLAKKNPTIFWTGARLISFIRGEPPQPLQARWRMAIETMPPPYTIGPSLVRQIAAELAALSAYGNLPVRLSDSVGDRLGRTLPSLMFMYLKDDDLETVCLLLRAMNYLKLRAQEFADGVEFVLRHHDRDGYFAMHRVALHLNAAQSGRDIRRSVFLPLSISALWALAECLFPTRAPFAAVANHP